MLRYSVIKQTVREQVRWGYAIHGADRRRRVYAHPETGAPFRTRGEVERWIAVLGARDQARTYHTVADVASWIFSDGSPWIDRQTRRRDGRPLSPRTIAEHKQHVDKYIIPDWGDHDPGEITAPAVEEWLYRINVSNRYRAAIWVTFRMVLEEFARRGVIRGVPRIEQPRGARRRKTALTLAQLHALFPESRAELQAIWSDPRESKKLDKLSGYRHEWLKLAACAGTMFFGGLRPQEARAVCMDQLCLDNNGLLVTRQTTDDNQVVEYLKGADARDPRYRYTLLPSFAVGLLQEWIEVGRPGWELFGRASGEPGVITNDHLYKRVRLAMRQSGLALAAGRYTPYSGRYTWRTLFAPRLDPQLSREIMGHRDDATHQAYNVPELAERIRERGDDVRLIEGVWKD